MAGLSTVRLDREAAGRYVLSRRTPLGGYSFYRTPEWGVEEPNAPDTLAALECLRTLDWPIPEPEATVAWLRGLQNDDGGYPTLTIGWAALRALALLGAAPDRSPAAWLDEHAEAIGRPTGARDWQGTLREALHVTELRRIGISASPESAKDPFSQLLDAARDPRGGWARPGADLETTAVAVSIAGPSRLTAEERSDAESFLRHCEDQVLGMRLTPESRATWVGALWGGLELAQGLELQPSYPGAVGACLADLQRADGGLGARHFAISTLRDTWRGLDAAQLLDHLQIDQLQEDKS
ncbi:MAG: prenyltransferase/squalene oxidase repeat-containing protein [Acidimicrobiales bacterium]